MLFLRSSSSHVVFLFFVCLIVAGSGRHSTAQPHLAKSSTPSLQPINAAEIEKAVLNGQTIVDRTIQSSDIRRILENPGLHTKNARLYIRDSRIVGTALRLSAPSKPVNQYSKDAAEHLTARGVSEAVHIALPIQVSNSVFDGGVNLLSVVFESELTFDKVNFQGSAYFQGSVFQKRVIFKQVRFGEISDFSGILFLDSSTFNGCDFTQQANFSNGNVGPNAKIYFTGQKIGVPIDFSNSVILGKLTFEGLEHTLEITNKIYLNAVNSKRQPSGELHIKNVEISNNVYLDRGHWMLLDFAEGAAGVHRPIRFDGFCDLRDGYFVTADFAGAEFGRGGDFEGARFDAISFQRTKFREPIRIVWNQLDGKLKRVDDNKPLDKESYRQLELNFKNINDLYGENQTKYQRRTTWEGRSFFWWLTGYWVDPVRTVFWLLCLFVLFSFVNWLAFHNRWFFGDRPFNTLVGTMPKPMQVALHAAALNPEPPTGFNATKIGQAIFVVQFVILKFMEICVVIVVSNTSPLLKQIVPYFFPG